MMDFALREEQRMVRDMVREFAEGELAPGVAARERRDEFPREPLRRAAELGLFGMTIPEEWGGAGLDHVSAALAIEEIACVCPSTSVTLSVTNSVCAWPIWKFGSPAVRKRLLPPLARGEKLGAFMLTEPGAGSDSANQKTRAVRTGDAYELTGTKAWVTNAGAADVYVTIAATDPSRGAKGISAFVVEAGTPGISIAKVEDKMGLRSSLTAQVVLDSVRVPAECRLGEEGQGMAVALESLSGGRTGIAAQAVGIARGAQEEAIRYARERHAFGKPIAEFQAIQWMLADSHVGIEAARALTLRAADLRDRGLPYATASSMAKLFAAEIANRVAAAAVQIHGGYGYSREYRVERLYRDARVLTIYEGTSQIQRMIIARSLLGASS